MHASKSFFFYAGLFENFTLLMSFFPSSEPALKQAQQFISTN